jgi:hypothetical protein
MLQTHSTVTFCFLQFTVYSTQALHRGIPQ